jgi:hypothetical protein
VTQRLWRGVEEPVPRVAEGTSACSFYLCCAELFDHRSPTTVSAAPGLDGHGYIFSCNHLPSPGLCKAFEFGIDRTNEAGLHCAPPAFELFFPGAENVDISARHRFLVLGPGKPGAGSVVEKLRTAWAI